MDEVEIDDIILYPEHDDETFKEKMKEEFTTKEANIKTQGGHNANKWE